MRDFVGRRGPAVLAALLAAVAVGAAAGLAGRCARTQATGGDATGVGSGIVPESERVAPEGTRRLRLPGVLTGGSVAGAQGYARDLLDASPAVCEAAYANEDGTVDVWQTQGQSEENVRRVSGELDSAREELAGRGIALEVSDDCRSVTLTAGGGATAQDLMYGVSRAVPGAADLQVESTGGEGFSLSVDIVDGTTGEVMGHADQDTYLGWSADLSWVGGGGGS